MVRQRLLAPRPGRGGTLGTESPVRVVQNKEISVFIGARAAEVTDSFRFGFWACPRRSHPPHMIGNFVVN